MNVHAAVRFIEIGVEIMPACRLTAFEDVFIQFVKVFCADLVMLRNGIGLRRLARIDSEGQLVKRYKSIRCVEGCSLFI